MPEFDAKFLKAMARETRSPHVMRKLAQHKETSILTALARNKHVTPDVAMTLAKHPNGFVATALGENSAIGPDVLDVLASHPEHDVVSTAVSHPNVSRETLIRASTHPESYVRGGVAAHFRTPKSVLKKLQSDDSYVSEYAIKSMEKSAHERKWQFLRNWRESEKERKEAEQYEEGYRADQLIAGVLND